MTIPDFDVKLNQFAEISVRVGLNLQPGQRLFLSAPLEAAKLAHKITAVAYQAGCRYVDLSWRDEQTNLIRHQYAPRDSFTEYPIYRAEGVIRHAQEGGAYLSILGENPDLLKEQDPDLIATAEKTHLTHMKPVYDLLDRNGFNWTLISYPTPAWAGKVFPGATPEASAEHLWAAIFQVCRIMEADPVAAWQVHISDLERRSAYLTEKQYHALHFLAPGTDLKVGLADRHLWMGGSETSQSGIRYTPNMPTEEVFTLPHRERIDGVVKASMPLSEGGQLIEGFSLTFESGRVTRVHAKRGEDMLRKLIEMDEGMSSLGEVALVPNSSPVSKSGTLFFNTLLDENAACHIALGKGFISCLQNGGGTSDEEYAARGGNSSLNHIDFMIGSGEMDIDGLLADGSSEAVMRSGEWAFQP